MSHPARQSIKRLAGLWRAYLAIALLTAVIAITWWATSQRDLLSVAVVRPYSQEPQHVIIINEAGLSDSHVLVSVGESVLWENASTNRTIRLLSKSFASPRMSPEERFQLRFLVSGTYEYVLRGPASDISDGHVVVLSAE